MIGTSQVLSYIVALGIAAVIPGPGMTALIARSVGGGAIVGYSMLFGLIIGDLVYLSFAIFGLSVVVGQLNELFVVVRWGAAIYLCYLAWQFWFADYQDLVLSKPIKKKDLTSACISGLTITLANPKTIAFYLALLPLVVEIEAITLQSWALILLPVTILVLLGIGTIYILGAVRVRHLLSKVRAQQILFRSAAVMMVSAAAIMLYR